MELLSKIQKELKAPKNQMNKFGGYKYRSCEDILEAVKPLLPEGATLVISDEVVQIGERYYVKATATITDGTKGSDYTASASAYAREAETKKGMDDAQITGSASSYARKYALNGLFCIDDTKDNDTQDNTEKATDVPFVSKDDIKKALKDRGIEPKNLQEAQDAVKELTNYDFIQMNYEAIYKKLTS